MIVKKLPGYEGNSATTYPALLPLNYSIARFQAFLRGCTDT